MAAFTKAEAATITRAWESLTFYLDPKPWNYGANLQEALKGERKNGKGGGGLKPWSLHECRFYVLRQVADGIRDYQEGKALSPADLYGIRPSLRLAYMLGASLAHNYGRTQSIPQASLIGAVDDARLAHEAALQRARG